MQGEDWNNQEENEGNREEETGATLYIPDPSLVQSKHSLYQLYSSDFCSSGIVAPSNSFSSNLSNPIFRGGINQSVCRSNFQGTSHFTQGQDDSSTAAVHCTVLHSTILYSTTLYYTVLYFTLLYIGVPCFAINISIRYGSEWVTFCRSYVFCH